jgi:hypothetical protein
VYRISRSPYPAALNALYGWRKARFRIVRIKLREVVTLQSDARTVVLEECLENFFWPADFVNAPPEHFRECIALLKTVKDREEEIVLRLRGYLEFADDAAVRQEIEIFIRTLEDKQLAQATKAKKNDARTRKR